MMEIILYDMFSIYAKSSIKEETGFFEDILVEVYARNFNHLNPKYVYMVYKYIHMYPKLRQSSTVMGMSGSQFKSIFYTTLEQMCDSINELDYDIRLSPYNHCIHYPTRVTAIVDTYAIKIANPVDFPLSRALYNPKYSSHVLKWQLVVDLLGNFLVLTGPHVLYDGHIFQRTMNEHPLYYWELWLGDGHYIGLPQVLTPFRRDHPLSYSELGYNVIHSFYRSRVEQSIRRIRIHSMFNQVFRGSWNVLDWSMKVIVHTTAVENRFRPKYAYCGPWLHSN